jgi:hypothetical protein
LWTLGLRSLHSWNMLVCFPGLSWPPEILICLFKMMKLSVKWRSRYPFFPLNSPSDSCSKLIMKA